MTGRSLTPADRVAQLGRQVAVETMLTLLWAEHLRHHPNDLPLLRAQTTATGERLTFEELGDPADSDLAAQQCRETMERLLERAAALAEAPPPDPSPLPGP